MAQLISFAVSLLLVFAIIFVNCSDDKLNFNDGVRVAQNVEQNPINKILHRLNKRSIVEDSPTETPKVYHKVYKFGNRVDGRKEFIFQKLKTKNFYPIV